MKISEVEKYLPFLPGHRFGFEKEDLKNHRKSHAFDYCNSVAVFRQEAPGIGSQPLNGQCDAQIKTSVSVYPHKETDGEVVPAWIAFDRKVLRFYGYFVEAVNERREEQYRIRKVNIYFYLEDDTIHVGEPKVTDSGIPHGNLIRRHRITKPDSAVGQHYIVSDFNVGLEVTFYSRTFKIIGCDGFTRQFLTELGVNVPSNGEFPEDPYTSTRQELMGRMKPKRPYQPQTSLKQFLENDRRVLRFSGIWDDSTSLYGQLHYLEVLYYLSDDTIEVHEIITGKNERSATFLKRCKLPKRPSKMNLQMGAENHAISYYSDADLIIGTMIHIYGRPVVICDCDEFTKSYYTEKYGLGEFDPIRVEDYQEEVEPAPAPKVQNHGTSLLLQQNAPPKANFKRVMAYDNVCLRFSARLISNKTVDRDRKFIISLFMADDFISVFEPHQRNSGIVGGGFLEKSRIRKMDQEGQYFTSHDFAVGATLNFYGHHFHIVEADDFAQKFMSNNPQMFASQV